MTNALRDLDFKVQGAHVALVSRTLNGGPANKWDVLITKGLKDVDADLVQKAAQIRVEMSFSDFLQKWYGMWHTDAEALATLLGYESSEEKAEVETYQDFIESKLEGITLLKGFDLQGDVEKALSELQAEQVLSVLSTQEVLEPLMADIEKAKGDPMMIEKSQHETLLKAAVDAAVETAVAEITVTLTKAQSDLVKAQEDLVKALEDVNALQAEKAAAKAALRKQNLVKAVGQAEAETLEKSLATLDDAAFDVVLKSLEAKSAAVQDSLLTKELGVGAEGTTDEDATRAILLSKYSRQ